MYLMYKMERGLGLDIEMPYDSVGGTFNIDYVRHVDLLHYNLACITILLSYAVTSHSPTDLPKANSQAQQSWNT